MRTEVVYGIHVVRSLLKQSPERILELSILEDRQDKRISELRALAKTHGIAVQTLNKKQMNPEDTHQGVMARIRPLPSLSEHDLFDLIKNAKKMPFFLVLDHVQDPHNLGACLRTADAVGVDAVIIPKDRSAHLTPLVRKVASGAAETVPCIEVNNLQRCLKALKEEGIWIIGTSGEANKTVYQIDLKIPLALVLGAEGQGLKRLTSETCDMLASIPMQGIVESLNVSVAAGVCMYEVLRQRNG